MSKTDDEVEVAPETASRSGFLSFLKFKKRKKDSGKAGEPVGVTASGSASSKDSPGEAKFRKDSRPSGPYDSDGEDELQLFREVGRGREVLDFGSLKFLKKDGRQVSFVPNPLGQPRALLLTDEAYPGLLLQLELFAAPTNRPLWPDVRSSIVESLPLEHPGSRFTELLSKEGFRELLIELPVGEESAGSPGSATKQLTMLLGIDGPRWLLRLALMGEAVRSREVRESYLSEVLGELLVVRGLQPYPPEQALEFRLPEDYLVFEEPLGSVPVSTPQDDREVLEVEQMEESLESSVEEQDKDEARKLEKEAGDEEGKVGVS